MRREKSTSVLSPFGKVTVPRDLRKQLGIEPGTAYRFSLSENGTLTLSFDQPQNEKTSGMEASDVRDNSQP